VGGWGAAAAGPAHARRGGAWTSIDWHAQHRIASQRFARTQLPSPHASTASTATFIKAAAVIVFREGAVPGLRPKRTGTSNFVMGCVCVWGVVKGVSVVCLKRLIIKPSS
jgi:hypothetical protein